jgi:dihydrofolate synthase/folylpolyglutamate synthase
MKSSFFERLDALRPSAMTLGLDRIRDAAHALGDPQRTKGVAWALVGGTNGKGSTSTFLAAILTAHGHPTGLYTSPHLVRPNERISLDGVALSDAALERYALPAVELAERAEVPVTWFEAMTLAALCCFAAERVRFGVLEVGLGGRLDATNVVDPAVSVITSVALDHTRWLGETVQEIAWEKGGISRASAPLVTALDDALLAAALRGRPQPARVDRLGRDMRGRIEGGRFEYEDDEVRLADVALRMSATYQAGNAALAVRASRHLLGGTWDAERAAHGLSAAFLHGRLDPRTHRGVRVLLDGAHNPAAGIALASAIAASPPARPVVAVVAVRRDKDAAHVLEPLLPLVSAWWFPDLGGDPWTPARELAAFVGDRGHVASSAADALDRAVGQAGPGGTVLVTGSLYFLGEIIPLLEADAAGSRGGA